MTSAPVRPRRPSIAELREVTQPPSIRGRRSAEHWTGDLYMRRISPYLTRMLVRAGFTANAVTALMIVSGAASGFALLVPGLWGALLAVALTQLQMLWDASDGEVARWRGTSSPLGIFLDRVGHYLTESLIPLALGVRAAGGLDDVVAGRARLDDARCRAGRGDRAQQGTQRHGARGASHGRGAEGR